MPDERDKPGGEPEAESSAEGERPTGGTPFDPATFARAILTPSAMRAATGDDVHTRVTPAKGTDQATSPAGDTPSKAKRRKTPASAISLVNARIPSNLPPRPAASPEKQDEDNPASLSRVDSEWASLEIASRPPPAGEAGDDSLGGLAQDHAPRLDLDDVDLVAASGRRAFDAEDEDEDEDEDEHSIDTVRRPIPESAPLEGAAPIKSREREMTDRVSLGDYSGALEIAEQILADRPDDGAAKACAENCRSVLRQMYATRIGPLDRVPVVVVPRDQLRWLSIDHKAGFVLSLVDGVSNLEMIMDVSGMPELETLRILSELAQQRIISLR